jgi:hypothetical protein
VVPTLRSTGVLSTLPRAIALNEDMGRCVYCHSIVTRQEDSCYACGDRVPKQARATLKQRPVSPLTNVVFMASLAFTAYCFLAEHKLSLPVTLTISASLLLIRIIAERLVNRNAN